MIESPAVSLPPSTPASEAAPESPPKPSAPKKATKKRPARKASKKAKKPTKKKAAPKKPARSAKKPSSGRRLRVDGKPDMRRGPKGNPPAKVVRNGEKGYGLKVAKARKAKGWTQRQLAVAIGMTQPAICNIEKGTCKAGIGVKAKLRNRLGVK